MRTIYVARETLKASLDGKAIDRALSQESLHILDCFTNLHTPLRDKITFIQYNYMFASLCLYDTPAGSSWVPATLRPPPQ